MSFTRRSLLQLGLAMTFTNTPLQAGANVQTCPRNISVDSPQRFNIGGEADPMEPVRREIFSRLALQADPQGQEQLAKKKQNLVLLLPVGGTNGVVPGGMASALLQYASWLQHTRNPGGETVPGSHIFNTIRSASAGAFTAPYLAAGQKEGLAIYYHFLKGKDFYDIGRMHKWLFRPKTHTPPMDINYIFKVITDYVPLHTADALSPKAPKLEIQATSMPERKPVTLTDFGNRETLFQALQATSRQPLNGLRPFLFDGRKMIDGGFSDPLCLHDAYRDTGDTLYVLFSNLPANYKARSVSNEMDYFALNAFRHYPSSFRLLGALATAMKQKDAMVKEGRLLVLSPSSYIKATDTRGDVLEAGAQDGMAAFCRLAFGGRKMPVIERTTANLPEGNYPGKVPFFKLQL